MISGRVEACLALFDHVAPHLGLEQPLRIRQFAHAVVSIVEERQGHASGIVQVPRGEEVKERIPHGARFGRRRVRGTVGRCQGQELIHIELREPFGSRAEVVDAMLEHGGVRISRFSSICAGQVASAERIPLHPVERDQASLPKFIQ
jgi:hypothetical protein